VSRQLCSQEFGNWHGPAVHLDFVALRGASDVEAGGADRFEAPAHFRGWRRRRPEPDEPPRHRKLDCITFHEIDSIWPQLPGRRQPQSAARFADAPPTSERDGADLGAVEQALEEFRLASGDSRQADPRSLCVEPP
jgi:hypothetical protein